MDELSKQYNPKEVEDKWYSFWESNNLFNAKPNPSKKPFCIVIPPPNITGILHMGHALNNTIQDILIRYQRMKNKESLWMPGTDHAGIATQNVVERQIAKEGFKRQDLGREKFLERVWAWQKQYGLTIISQLKKLGASCDWSRARFTLDEGYSAAVIEVFVRLYDKGLIYQGDYIINWCPRCQTALSDEEAPHSELPGHLYYLKYPFKGNKKEFMVVATTRPETMLGDSAVAVNPKDKRYKKFIGETLILPLLNREIKIIADNMVDIKFGTGAVKVTPAHDANDYLLGRKHDLEFINIMQPDGVLNKKAGKYAGLDRFKARQAICEDLKEKGLLEKIVDYPLSAGHCYRCHTIVEPYLSKQWFVKMKPLAKQAIEVVKKGKIKFHPARWRKVYLNWMENLSDWCISRQIWWGHRIPVYYCKSCQETGILKSKIKNQKSKIEDGIIVSRIKSQNCPKCGSSDIYQDEDVLDTWFSSWLWPFATFGWPFEKRDEGRGTRDEEDLKYFYPTSVLVTAPEIIFFWVARMIMAGLEFMGEVPFRDVYIHGTVRDIEGKKMSKSLGNVIDPLEVIAEYGADALRFSLVSITATGQDVFLSTEKFQMGRNFANKIWNASRFILMNFKAEALPPIKREELNIQERWILSRLHCTIKNVTSALEKFDFNESSKLLYDFFWHEFCDWFIELSKDDCLAHRQITKSVLLYCLDEFLKLLHPFMPFISEEIYSRISNRAQSIMNQPYPVFKKEFIDKIAEDSFVLFTSLVSRVRNLRAELSLAPTQLIDCLIIGGSDAEISFLNKLATKFKLLTKCNSVVFSTKAQKPPQAVVDVEASFSIYIPLAGVVDIQSQCKRMEKRLEELKKVTNNITGQLKNSEFLKKAPSEVVASQKEKLEANKRIEEKLQRMLDALK